MFICSHREKKKTNKQNRLKTPKKQMFGREECSQFTTELDAYVILLNTDDFIGRKTSSEATSKMLILFCKIKMHCHTVDVFSSLTSASCHGNSNNFFVLYPSY